MQIQPRHPQGTNRGGEFARARNAEPSVTLAEPVSASTIDQDLFDLRPYAGGFVDEYDWESIDADFVAELGSAALAESGCEVEIIGPPNRRQIVYRATDAEVVTNIDWQALAATIDVDEIIAENNRRDRLADQVQDKLAADGFDNDSQVPFSPNSDHRFRWHPESGHGQVAVRVTPACCEHQPAPAPSWDWVDKVQGGWGLKGSWPAGCTGCGQQGANWTTASFDLDLEDPSDISVSNMQYAVDAVQREADQRQKAYRSELDMRLGNELLDKLDEVNGDPDFDMDDLPAFPTEPGIYRDGDDLVAWDFGPNGDGDDTVEVRLPLLY